MSCMTCVKYLVFIFNLLFWLCGMAVLGLALWLRFDPSAAKFVAISDQETYYVCCYILIGAGGLMTVLGFLGCCGAWKENRCMLVTFFLLLLIILAAEIAAGVYAYMNRTEIEEQMIDSLKNFIQTDYKYDEEGKSKDFDNFMQENECCGSNNRNDFNASNLPASCCPDLKCTQNNVFDQGCGIKVIDYFKDNLFIIMIVGIAIGALEVIGMILSMALCCMIRRRYDGYKN